MKLKYSKNSHFAMYLGLFFLILFLVFVIKFFSLGSFISHNGHEIPLTTESFLWNGYSCSLETIYLGSFEGAGDYEISENDDGKNRLSNYIEISDNLVLTSSFESGDDNPKANNYIKVICDLPAGTLSGNYDFFSKNYYSGDGSVSFKVGSFLSESFTPTGSGKVHSLSGGDSFSFVLDSPKKIIFQVVTNADYKYENYQGELTLNFVEKQTSFKIVSDSVSNVSFIQKFINWIKNFLSFEMFSLVSSLNDSVNFSENISENLSASALEYEALKSLDLRDDYDPKNQIVYIRLNDDSEELISENHLVYAQVSNDYKNFKLKLNTCVYRDMPLYDNIVFYLWEDKQLKNLMNVKDFKTYKEVKENVSQVVQDCGEIINGSQVCTSQTIIEEVTNKVYFTSEDFEENGSCFDWFIEGSKAPWLSLDLVFSQAGVPLRDWVILEGDGSPSQMNFIQDSPENNSFVLNSEVFFNCSVDSIYSLESYNIEIYKDNSWDIILSQPAYTFSQGSSYSSYPGVRSIFDLEEGGASLSLRYTKDTSLTPYIWNASYYQYGSDYTVYVYMYLVFNYVNGSTYQTEVKTFTQWNNEWRGVDFHNPFVDEPVSSIDYYASYELTSGRAMDTDKSKIELIYASKDFISNFYESYNLTDDTLWRCSACDEYGFCENSSIPYLVRVDKPVVSVISPTGSFSSRDFNVIFYVNMEGNLSTGVFNITRGESVEVGNIYVYEGDLTRSVNVSGEADYSLNYCFNTTTGFMTCGSSPFSVSSVSSVVYSSGNFDLMTYQDYKDFISMRDWWKMFWSRDSDSARVYNPVWYEKKAQAWADFKYDKSWENFVIWFKAFGNYLGRRN